MTLLLSHTAALTKGCPLSWPRGLNYLSPSAHNSSIGTMLSTVALHAQHLCCVYKQMCWGMVALTWAEGNLRGCSYCVPGAPMTVYPVITDISACTHGDNSQDAYEAFL